MAVLLLVLMSAAGAAQSTKLGGEIPTRPRGSAGRAGRDQRPAPRAGVVVVLTGVARASVRLVRSGPRPQVVERDAGEDGGAVFERLAPGVWRVEAVAPEHHPAMREAVVEAGRSLSVDARLQPVFGAIVLGGVDLAVADRFSVDGRVLGAGEAVADGEGRIHFRVEPGEREVLVEGPGRVAHRERVRVTAGEETPVAVALPVARGRLRVRTLAGAAVYVDDAPAGAAPGTGELAVSVEPGERRVVRVEAPGYEAFTTQVAVAAGMEARVEALLRKKPTSGPFGDLFIDDTLDRWAAPAEWKTVPSRQTLVVSGRGAGLAREVFYEDFQLRFNLVLLDAAGAGWVVRGDERGTGYLFVLTGPGAPWPNQLRVYALDAGQYDPKAVLYAPLPVIPDVVVGESYTVRVVVEGDRVRTFLRSAATGEEVSVGNFVDSRQRFRSGGFGFAGVGGRFEINGVEAAPLAPPPAAPGP